MKQCNCANEAAKKVAAAYSSYKNVFPPVELLSGRTYLNFTCEKVTKSGRMKQIEVPMLLTKCPFCGKKYEGDLE